MKTGLFFGSFNPVHVGHLVIANYMLSFTDLEQVWLVVSPHNPLKEKKNLLPQHHRLRLVQEAIGEHPQIKASDIEFKLSQPSYTIDTLTYLQEKYPTREFVLIMGSDNLATLHKWKNYQQLITQYKIYVYPRKNIEEVPVNNYSNVIMTSAPLVEISSTFLRNAIKEGKDVSFFMPPAAHNYLKEMHFYEK